MRSRLWIPALALILALAGFGNAVWIFAKAQLAQYLIADAWENTLQAGDRHKPWHWADTWPVARLRHAASNTDLYVLQGAQGNSLAFGPGHQQGTVLPGKTGLSLIGGHRDTHFRFLKEVQLKDELQIQDTDGHWHDYRVRQLKIDDSRAPAIAFAQNRNLLVLVTCYPFDAVHPGGPLRYVVIAEPMPAGGFSIAGAGRTAPANRAPVP